MKRHLIYVLTMVLLMGCVPSTYQGMSNGGHPEKGSIVVLTRGRPLNNVTIDVEGRLYTMQTVYNIRDEWRARKIVLPAGQQMIRITDRGRVIYQQIVFIRPLQTRRIII